ncbi:MAG: hypothetical protein O3A39_06740 [Proteobacteria bacterium]|nr:hypothetical protein [Pseudomonadota bacterium]
MIKNILSKTKNLIKGEGKAIKQEYLGIKKYAKKKLKKVSKRDAISNSAVNALTTVAKYPYATTAVAGTGFYLYGGRRNAYEDDEII